MGVADVPSSATYHFSPCTHSHAHTHMHTQTHTQCPFDGCPWRFATPYKLRRHIKSHTKETPYLVSELVLIPLSRSPSLASRPAILLGGERGREGGGDRLSQFNIHSNDFQLGVVLGKR